MTPVQIRSPDRVDRPMALESRSSTQVSVMHRAECGFCEHGEQEALIAAGTTEIGGRLPVNTDGGSIATGLRQVVEVVTQLRGGAGDRQVPGRPRVGFTHVDGAPGVSACTVLSR